MRILTGCDNQMHLRRHIFKEKRENIINRLTLNNMVIVQNKDKRLGDMGDLIQQVSQNRISRGWLGGLECSQQTMPNILEDRLQSGDKVCQKRCSIFMLLIQGQPGNWLFTISDPFAD